GCGNINVEVTADYKFENADQESRELEPEQFLIHANLKQQMDLAAGPAPDTAGVATNIGLALARTTPPDPANKSQLKME
ncbi:MAG: hypothetical protein GY818_16735, partial [Planctomycetaceae bacterium]|nr:hypothetical protein [Planctomycetaceae bacterium]